MMKMKEQKEEKMFDPLDQCLCMQPRIYDAYLCLEIYMYL